MRMLILLAALLGSTQVLAATTVHDFVGSHSGPIGDLTVSDAKKAGRYTANTLVSINGRWLTLPRGTAAFDIGFTDGDTARRFLVILGLCPFDEKLSISYGVLTSWAKST